MDADTIRRLSGDGTTESCWRPWLSSVDLPSLSLPPGGDLLVVAPHPDDEVFGVGGIIASFPRCRLVAVTDGEASHPPPVIDPAELARRRSAERAAALAALGRPDLAVARLGHPDGGVEPDLLAAQLASMLRPGDTCLATWRGDGHPDHEAVGEAARFACARVGARLWEYPIWMWHWASPADHRVPWELARRFDLDPGLRRRKSDAVEQFASQITKWTSDPAEQPILRRSVLAHFERDAETVFVAEPLNRPHASTGVTTVDCFGEVAID